MLPELEQRAPVAPGEERPGANLQQADPGGQHVRAGGSALEEAAAHEEPTEEWSVAPEGLQPVGGSKLVQGKSVKRMEQKGGAVRAQFSLPITLCPAESEWWGRSWELSLGKERT